MAQTSDDSRDVAGILGSNERLIRKLHPDVLSFFRYYGIGILLLIWTVVLTWLFLWGPFKDFEDLDWFGKGINPMLPAILWFVVALPLGIGLGRRLHVALQALYWLAAVLMLVLTGLFIWLWENPGFAPRFSIIYAYLDAILTILIAEIYRRAFSYYITDLRIVIRYKLFSTNEVNIRFEKIEDWKIARSFVWRIFGVGTIRPYTGTEDGKADEDRAFDAPDECMYGIRGPERVKRLLVDLVLERDQIHTGVEVPTVEVPASTDEAQVEAPAGQGEPEAPAAEPAPPEPPAPQPYATTAQETEPEVRYYQPAPAPPPARNYERVEVDEGIPPPAPDDEEDEDGGGPSPVRRMYPQAVEPGVEPRLVEQERMDFEVSQRRAPKKKPSTGEEPDPDQEVYDDSRPRAL